MRELIKMKNKYFSIIMIAFLCFTISACSSRSETVTALEDTGTSSVDLMEETITDKNLKLVAPYIFVIEGDNMDDFWTSYLPDVNIQNEWFHAAEAGYTIAISGALKDDTEQGTINLISVNSDYTVTDSRQSLAPSKGGSLSVIDKENSKEFNMEVKDEQGTVYLVNFYNGFTAYKDGGEDDWEYWK